jgi:hypothetical protein
LRYTFIVRRCVLALALIAAFTSTAWALAEFWEMRCDARDHRGQLHGGWTASPNDACATAAQHLKAYPKHKPYVVFRSDSGDGDERWDCRPVQNPPASPHPNGIVLRPEQALVCFGIDDETYRMPTKSEIARLESALAQSLKNIAAKNPDALRVMNHMWGDVRYYVGTKDGFILVNGNCDETARCGRSTKSDPGSCEWHIRFDTKDGTFDNFRTGGRA